MEIPEEKQVKMVADKLKGAVSAWWDHKQSTRRRHGELPISSWAWMKQLMYDQFLLSDYQQILYITIVSKV